MGNASKSRRNNTPDDKKLEALLDNLLGPRQPVLRLYRLSEEGRQIRLDVMDIDEFSHERVKERFGGGKFLLRSVRGNGTYGPSRVFQIAGSPKEKVTRYSPFDNWSK